MELSRAPEHIRYFLAGVQYCTERGVPFAYKIQDFRSEYHVSVCPEENELHFTVDLQQVLGMFAFVFSFELDSQKVVLVGALKTFDVTLPPLTLNLHTSARHTYTSLKAEDLPEVSLVFLADYS